VPRDLIRWLTRDCNRQPVAKFNVVLTVGSSLDGEGKACWNR
jgi:hypothetical protein